MPGRIISGFEAGFISKAELFGIKIAVYKLSRYIIFDKPVKYEILQVAAIMKLAGGNKFEN